MSERRVRYFIKAQDHKSYIKERVRYSRNGRKYAWTSNRSDALSWTDREVARSVARRYGGRVVTL